MPATADAYELLESALQAPDGERAYYARQSLDALPEGHAACPPLQRVLDGHIDAEAGLRAAYGELPPGRDEGRPTPDGDAEASETDVPPSEERLTVPALYHVPRDAAERAVDRFRHRAAADGERVRLRDVVLEEVDTEPVVYVAGEPLGDWAHEHVDQLVVGTDEDHGDERTATGDDR